MQETPLIEKTSRKTRRMLRKYCLLGRFLCLSGTCIVLFIYIVRLHNSYTLASAWKIVSETLNSFAVNGVRDKNIKSKLKSDSTLRERYLLLGDMVKTLVELGQKRFSVLATTTRRSCFFVRLRNHH